MPHGIKIAAYSRQPRQPSPRKNQCSRQGKHPIGSVLPTDQGEGVPLPFFLYKGRPISGSFPHLFLRAGDQVSTLVVTRSATAPQHSNHPLPTAPTCSTSSLPVVVFTVQAVPTPPHGGPGPTTALCDSCFLPFRRGTRPLECKRM